MESSSVDKSEILKSFLLSVAVSLFLYRLWVYRHLYRFALEFPGHLGLPFLGFVSQLSSLKDVIPVVNKMFSKCKSYTICVWFGMYPAVFTADPEFVEKVLSTPELLNKARPMYNFLDSQLENGLITSRVEKWHKFRKLINPTFSHKVLLSFMPVFNKAKNLGRMKLDALVGRGEHKICNMLHRIALGITVETTMGKVLNEGEEVEENLAEKCAYLLKHAAVITVLGFMKMSGLVRFHKRYNDTKAYLKNFIAELVQQRMNASKDAPAEGPNGDDDDDVDVVELKKNPNIFIDLVFKLLQRKQLTWQDIVGESNTIVFASFETTGNAIFNTLVLLAMHPEVQEKLYEELVDVFPEKDFEFEYEHMQQLPYLDRVFNEMLRLCPSVPLIGRHVERDIQLTKDLRLPQGLQVLISIFHLHRRPEIWGPDANQFDPDRFLPENMAGKHSYAFIPFSKGSRNCIGWRYAILSAKTIVSGLVRNFRFTTSFKYEDLEFVSSITLQYHKEPGLEIHRR